MNESNIIEFMKEVDIMIDFDAFDFKDSFTNQGIDSLDLSSLFFLVEEKCNIKIPDTELESLNSADDLIQYINEKTCQ